MIPLGTVLIFRSLIIVNHDRDYGQLEVALSFALLTKTFTFFLNDHTVH
jgi:hypothetical protein